MIDKGEIKKLAQLSRITVSEQEVNSLAKEIESILNYVSDVQKVTSGKTTTKAGVLRNVMREDGKPHTSGLYTDALLKEMPKTEKGYLKVKKILVQD